MRVLKHKLNLLYILFFRNTIVIRGDAHHAVVHLRTINQFLKLVYQIVPRYLILQRIVLLNLIFPKSEPGQLQTIYATAWKIKKDIIWEIVIRGNAHHAAVHLRTINQFLKLVLFLRK